MEIKEIVYSGHFQRALKRLPRETKETIRKREGMFKKNCFDPRLNTHKLKGKLRYFWSFSLTYSHRVLFQFLDKGRVGFIAVDDHSISQ